MARHSLIAVALLLPLTLPATLASMMLGHGLWKAGFNRCEKSTS